MPCLSTVLSKQSEAQQSDDAAVNASKSKKSRKRARGYEGDEVFKVSREVIFPTAEDGKVVLAALDGEFEGLASITPYLTLN